jgi:Peptidase family M1 domain
LLKFTSGALPRPDAVPPAYFFVFSALSQKNIRMKSSFFSLFISLLCTTTLFAQPDRWQQRVKYKMDIALDVNTNRFTGKQRLEYFNNSPDTLKKLFYHLYWNAFRPGSMMDTRSIEQGGKQWAGRPDWDGRVRDRISKLKPDEVGYQKVLTLKRDGRIQKILEHETILEVVLDKPILPKSKVLLEMDFEAQVPLQVRRSGRDNAEGVRYSMSQWYPKIAEYDYQGWHANPYVGREFYGVWGDFEVNITLDKNYMIGATGYLQNAAQIGYGYEKPGTKPVQPAGNKLTWKFTAPNVHDFVWAADNNYRHITRTVRDSTILHFIFKANATDAARWEQLADLAVRALPLMDKQFGYYPYKQYSFIQGGDGGMEYPMATLIKTSSFGTAIHEWMHSWYHGMMGTNESLYAWMDEGFTSYGENLINNILSNYSEANPHLDSYNSYFLLVKSGKEEPLTTHADHFNLNGAYSTAAYSKGEVFLCQLGYITGSAARDKTLLEYYRLWRFKHPNVNDFIRVAENVSGMELDWYKEYWVNSTKTIDYKIDSLWEDGGVTKIRLRRLGLMPMPIDLKLSFRDGSSELHYVPLGLMYGAKPPEDAQQPHKVYQGWNWTSATYTIESKRRLNEIQVAEIDPSLRLADIDRKNNKLELQW